MAIHFWQNNLLNRANKKELLLACKGLFTLAIFAAISSAFFAF
jgi:hypothetical protein